MQDTTLAQQNVPLSDSQISPNKSTANQPASVDFSFEKETKKPAYIQQYKKSLPPDVRDHFEANSFAFVEFAQKKDANLAKKTEVFDEEDIWDRALLFGEYPGGKIPVSIETETDKITFTVPKKPKTQEFEDILPNRVFSKISTKEETTEKEEKRADTPINIHVEKIILPRFVPKKSENTVQQINREEKLPLKDIVVPLKPKEIKEKSPVSNTLYPKNINNLSLPHQEMSETLQKKIIEGQMRNVFENAPVYTRESLEKMLAKDILALKDTDEPNQNSDYFWKKRLRDYVLKLRWQGKSSFKNPWDTDPKEGETVFAFIQRIYPIVMREETKEEQKHLS